MKTFDEIPNKIDPVRCYSGPCPDGSTLHYGLSALSGDWYVPVPDDAAKIAGEEGERVVTHPISGDNLVRLDWLAEDGYPEKKLALFKEHLQKRILFESN